MAQPTRSDDQAVRRRLGHNNLRRKKWRRRLPRAGRKRPRRSGNSSAVNLRGARRAPHFFYLVFPACNQLLLASDRTTCRRSAHEARSPKAGPTCQAAECAGETLDPAIESTSEGRNPQWRRRPKAERRRRRRRDSAPMPKEGTLRRPPFVYVNPSVYEGSAAGRTSYRSVVPSQICTRRITSHGWMRSTISIPFTTRPNTV